jgi:hypothetical protein
MNTVLNHKRWQTCKLCVSGWWIRDCKIRNCRLAIANVGNIIITKDSLITNASRSYFGEAPLPPSPILQKPLVGSLILAPLCLHERRRPLPSPPNHGAAHADCCPATDCPTTEPSRRTPAVISPRRLDLLPVPADSVLLRATRLRGCAHLAAAPSPYDGTTPSRCRICCPPDRPCRPAACLLGCCMRPAVVPAVCLLECCGAFKSLLCRACRLAEMSFGAGSKGLLV